MRLLGECGPEAASITSDCCNGTTVPSDGDPSYYWQLLLNNAAAAQLYGRFSLSLGRIYLPAEIGLIRLRENDMVSLVIANNTLAVDPTPQRAGGRAVGWFYPKDLDPKNIW